MAITTYSELQTAVANWLNRADLNVRIPEFIALAEASFRRDKRVRILKTNSSFQVDSEVESLPSDFDSIESFYHDGPSIYGPLEVVGGDRLGEVKGLLGDSGVPQFVAVQETQFKFAPEPNGTYTLSLVYWASIQPLSSSLPSNWLLVNHPDVYLYGALVESAPYLRDDERIAVWGSELNRRLDELHKYVQNKQFSGTLVRRPNRPIG